MHEKNFMDLLHLLFTLLLSATVIFQAFKIQMLESRLREKELESRAPQKS